MSGTLSHIQRIACDWHTQANRVSPSQERLTFVLTIDSYCPVNYGCMIVHIFARFLDTSISRWPWLLLSDGVRAVVRGVEGQTQTIAFIKYVIIFAHIATTMYKKTETLLLAIVKVHCRECGREIVVDTGESFRNLTSPPTSTWKWPTFIQFPAHECDF